MAIDLQTIQKNYPFLSCVKVAKEEYLGIIQNADSRVISLYCYDVIPTNLREQFLEFGKSWWWESNRKLPINIFIGPLFLDYREYLRSFSVKESEIIFGPVTQLSNLTKQKIRKRTVQLVRRIN